MWSIYPCLSQRTQLQNARNPQRMILRYSLIFKNRYGYKQSHRLATTLLTTLLLCTLPVRHMSCHFTQVSSLHHSKRIYCNNHGSDVISSMLLRQTTKDNIAAYKPISGAVHASVMGSVE